MVNEPLRAQRQAERSLALSYAVQDRREALATLFALDDRLGKFTRMARDPTIGVMRLTWWGEALARLDHAPPPAEPLLQALAAQLLPSGVAGAELEQMADGWARLLEPDPVDLAGYATERGATLFAAAARVLGGADARVPLIGQGWALAALGPERPVLAAEGSMLAGERLAECFRTPWSRALRPLGALGLLARYDAEGRIGPGDPRRIGRLLWHRLTGR